MCRLAADVGAGRRGQREQLRARCLGVMRRGSGKPGACPPVGGVPRLTQKARIFPPPWGLLGLRPAYP